uniref:Uncharacterized protein n=1 Tax=Psilocybe cubensis TaxID=181762 RepID=A0A8H7XPB0_PSICU
MTSIRRHGSFTHYISLVPPEVAHKILDDLPMGHLLQLICDNDIPHLEGCIISHLVLGKLFSAEYLAEIKELYSLYLRICRVILGHIPQLMHALRYDGRIFVNRHGVFCNAQNNYPVLRNSIISAAKAAIINILHRYESSLPVLRNYAPRPIGPKSIWTTTTVEDLTEIFENLDAAEMKLKSIKSAQLQRMANIVQNYPGMVRTRWNFAQDHLRNNQHLVDWLLQCAKTMQRRQIGRNRIVARSIFSCRRLYLVPYDRLLRLFLKTIERFQPVDKVTRIDNTRIVSHQYPTQLQVVLEGLTFVYSRDVILESAEETLLFRVPYKKQPWKSTASLILQPYFEKEPMLQVNVYGLDRSMLPASTRELDWLEAFLSICQYMVQMQEEWKPGQTVAEYWRTH